MKSASLFATVLVFLATLLSTSAGAAPAISQPTGNPYVVNLDAQGKPVPFTVIATGFPAGSLVYVEQCDGRAPNAEHWLPTRDCDIGSSPAAAIVDAKGTVRFPAGDVNHGFQSFTGVGPEGLFHCLPPSAAAPKDGLPEYRTCQIRVSSNNTQPTTDQVFAPIAFGSAPSSTPTTGAAATSTSDSGSSSSSTTPVVVGIVVGIAAISAVVAFVLRRRRTTASA